LQPPRDGEGDGLEAAAQPQRERRLGVEQIGQGVERLEVGLAAFVAAFPDVRYEVRPPTLDDLFLALSTESES
jgi:hypothetical protein